MGYVKFTVEFDEYRKHIYLREKEVSRFDGVAK